MKLYLVEDAKVIPDNVGSVGMHCVYGIFSSRDKAEKVLNELKKNFADNHEPEAIVIIEEILDEPTEDYDYFMNN